MANFLGKWTLVENKNFDEFLKSIGTGMIKVNVINKAMVDLAIEKVDSTWTIAYLTSLKYYTMNFTEGVEFDESIIFSK